MAPSDRMTFPGAGCSDPAADFEACGPPGGQAAVEQVNLAEAGVPQHPPQPGGGHVAAVVVRYDRVAVVDAPAARGRLELLQRRQRVPSAARVRRSGEFGGEIHEDGAGNVLAQVVVVTVRIAQRPAHVEEHCALAGVAGAVQPVLEGSSSERVSIRPLYLRRPAAPGRL